MLTDAVEWQVLMNKGKEGVPTYFYGKAHTTDFCIIS
jgi:hypothetical protein